MSIRMTIYQTVGHVVHARIEMEALKAKVLSEMEQGYRPTHRGHEWNKEMFDTLQWASVSLDVAFDLMKALQFPETLDGRTEDAIKRISDFSSSGTVKPLLSPTKE